MDVPQTVWGPQLHVLNWEGQNRSQQQLSLREPNVGTRPETTGSGPHLGVCHCNQPLDGCRKSEHFTGPGRSVSVSLCAAVMAVSNAEELSKHGQQTWDRLWCPEFSEREPLSLGCLPSYRWAGASPTYGCKASC